MTIASSHILPSPLQVAEYRSASGSTLAISSEEPQYTIVSPRATGFITPSREQGDEFSSFAEELLSEVVEGIQRLEPLEVDGETQKLLDAAIEHQETAPCDDVEGWASRLADDVKNAND